MENYINQLRAYHLKATPQRIAITEALDAYGHLSVEQLYTLLKAKFNSLSLATIYKNINIMMENAFVSEVKLPEQKSVYELTKESHAHLQCKECHNVWDIHLDLDNVIKSASTNSTFDIESANLVLTGVCEECQKRA